jgi:glycosyltransferase domain-containing protein
MSERLTIVLPLKGRSLFTLRFLWHANASRMPYHFLLADGQVRSQLTSVLANSREVFPNLNIEYLQYPDDVSFSRFFAKMHDAINRVRTPYVMLADNDDFLAPAGIERSMDFLDNAPDYVCCGGGIAGFSVYSAWGGPSPGLVGPFNKFAFRYAAEDRSQDIGAVSVAKRLVAGAQYSWGYYAVYRSGVLGAISREAVEIDFSDLMLYEWFCGLRTLTLGKARSDPAVIGYLRQYWTSLRSSFAHDWVHHLLRSRFTPDFSTVIDRLSVSAGQADNADGVEIGERLRQTFDVWYRGFLRHNYGPSGMLRQFLRENTPGLLLWLKRRRRYSVPYERRTLYRQLVNHGASADYLVMFRRELSAIENVLTGVEFAKFIQPYISVLGAADTAAVIAPAKIKVAAE